MKGQRAGRIAERIRSRAARLCRYPKVAAGLSVYRRFQELGVMEMSASTSYYMLFALFPFLVFILLIAAAVSGAFESAAAVRLPADLQQLLPPDVWAGVHTLLQRIRSTNYTALLFWGLLSLILACSKGFGRVVGNLNLIYGSRRIKSNFFLFRLLGVGVTLILGLMAVLVMLVLTVGQFLIQWLASVLGWQILGHAETWVVLSYLFSLAVLTAVFTAMLHIMSGRAGALRMSLLCSSLMGLIWIILSVLFSRVMTGSSRYTILYGSFAGLMLTLLWIFISMLVIYTGALVHAVWIRRAGLQPRPLGRRAVPEQH